MGETTTVVYDYGFCLWPNEAGFARIGGALKSIDGLEAVFSMIQHRVEVDVTEQQFGELRERLFRFGFELHEISRRPHADEEAVR